MYNIEMKNCPHCGKEKKRGYNEILRKDMYLECQCEIDARNEEEAKKRATAEEKYIEARIINSHLPKREQSARFDTMIVDSDNETAINAAKHIAKVMISGEDTDKNSLVLCGTTGSGKTYLSAAILNEYNKRTLNANILDAMSKGDNSNPIRSSCKFIKEYDLLKMLFSFYNDKNPVDEYKKSKILVIDDIGTSTANSEKTSAALFQIIDYRHSEKLSTIITTNLTTKQLKLYLGDRSFDRLEKSYYMIPLTSEKSRRKAAN